MPDEAVDQPIAGADPLLDVRRVTALRVVRPPTGRPPARLFLRSAVVDRLIGAQSLLPREFRLVVVAGHLPQGLARLPGYTCPHVAGHRTGGAADLGVQVKDEPEPSGWPATAPPGWDAVASALIAVGLVGASDAWWHWSFGDERWRSCTGATVSRYTAVP